MPGSLFSVTAELAIDENQAPVCCIKLQAPHAEINVWVSLAELPRLLDIEAARWHRRTSVAAGMSAGARAFWACDDDGLVVMVGPDDEAWDWCLSLPAACMSALLSEVRRVAAEAGLVWKGP